jgi:hypothetical protein
MNLRRIVTSPALWVVVAVVVVGGVLALLPFLGPGDLGLRDAPGVANADVRVSPPWPTRRLIQVCDFLMVPRGAFNGPGSYEDHLREMESVQEEEMTLLRWLAARFRLGFVYQGGLTREDAPGLRVDAGKLGQAERGEILSLRKEQATAAGGKSVGDARAARELQARLDAHRESVLRLGAAGRLLMSGALDDVQPLDDARPLTAERADPRDAKARKARQDAMTQNALRGGEPVVVVVLDGRFDLSESVREQHPNCGYIRVTTRAVARHLGQDR